MTPATRIDHENLQRLQARVFGRTTEDRILFRERLKARMAELGISHQQLATASGFSLVTVHNWTIGICLPSDIAAVEQALSVEPGWFFRMEA